MRKDPLVKHHSNPHLQPRFSNNPTTVIGVSSAIFGLVSLPSLCLRTWSLTKANSTTRPLGTTRWAMDYFNWNFALGFIYITALIVVSTVLKPAKSRIVSLPLSLLLLQVCTQLLATTVMVPLRARYPFRFSSMSRGEIARPALYTIIEDVVAVDAGQGTQFREVFDQRYVASAPIRRLLREMDLLWGISGVAVAVALVVLIFKLHNVDISWVIGKFPFTRSAFVQLFHDRMDANFMRHRLDCSMGLGCNLRAHHYCENQGSSDEREIVYETVGFSFHC
jgi:hypothetical protein